MAIDFQGKTYDNDWFPIDAMGNRLGDKDWAANADYASKTGTQNPYTNQAGSSPWDTSGMIPGNEPGSTMPKGPAAGGYLDQARINQYLQSLSRAFSTPSAPSSTPSFPQPPSVTPGGQDNWALGAPVSSSPYTTLQSRQASRGGSDADQIRNAYRSALGREASDAEVQGWTSGSYGGGGLGDWIRQIESSHEAQQYRPPSGRGQPGQVVGQQPGQSGPQTPVDGYGFPTAWTPGDGSILRWGQPQGPGTTPPGPPPPPTGSTVPGPQGGDYRSWLMQLVAGKPISPKTLKALEPILNQYGIRLGPLNARGFTDGIILPNGQFVDVIMSATEDGGSDWGWLEGGGHGSSGSGFSGGSGVGGGPLPGNQYNDPNTALLESLIKARIGHLQQGNYDPMRQQLMGAYDARQKALSDAAEPTYQALIQRLEQRFKDLQGPGYTGAENEAIRTQALDPIESDRTAARQRVIERLSQRGITLESGVAQQALMEVDKAFDAMRGTTQTTLATNDIQRREGRQQRADQIKSSLYDIPQGRAREQLDVFSAMDLLEGVMRNEEASRSREAIGYGGALADLGPQRLQLAMQAAGMGGNPQGMFNSLMQMAQLNQNSALLNQRNSGQLWSGLGSLSAILMNAGR